MTPPPPTAAPGTRADVRTPWWAATGAGVSATLVTLPIVLTLGIIGFAPLGQSAILIGVPAAFATVVAGGVVYALAGRSATPAGGPSSMTALILAALVAALADDPALRTGSAPALQLVLVGTGTAVVTCGLLMVLLAGSGLAQLVRFVPQPVLAGFMNGVALLVLLAQIPGLLGLEPDALSRMGAAAALEGRLGALLMGLATAGLIFWLAASRPRAPAALIGVAVGIAASALLQMVLPDLDLGPPLGKLPDGSLWPDALLPLRDPEARAFLARNAPLVLLYAVVLAIAGTLESMLSLQAFDQATRRQHQPRTELLGLGVANVVTGLCGGLPVVMLRARAIAMLQLGATGRVVCLAAAVSSGLLFVFGRPLLEPLPTAVLAGSMVTVAWALADGWSLRLARRWVQGKATREMRLSLLAVAIVCAITVWQGVAAGIALGLLLATATVVRQLNHSLLRASFDGRARPSRRIWPTPAETLLGRLRARIVILELEGALFFGSAARVAEAAGALDADCRAVIVDLRRVTAVDETGAVSLQQLGWRLAERGVTLMLAGITPRSATGRLLMAHGMHPDQPMAWHRDADHAMEAAERLLLAEVHGGAAQAAMRSLFVPLTQTLLFSGLDEAQAMRLAAAMPARTVAAGGWVFREGEPADGLYVAVSGSITVRLAGNPRLLSFSAGMMFGELAVLDGGNRSAGARADAESVVHRLTPQALEELTIADPVLAARLYRNIARHLSERLRYATRAWGAEAD